MATVQGSLFGLGELALRNVPVVRTRLDDGCWVDQAVGWVGGQMELFDQLAGSDLWHQGRREMYGTAVDEPRLTAGLRLGDPACPPVVRVMADELSGRYGLPMTGVWLNWYRDGEDAVAWHADRIGRVMADPPVAIVSLGSPRRLLLRPRGGGRSVAFQPGGGDLLVMGGACQHRWEHSVTRSRGGGQRISVTFRPPGGPAAVRRWASRRGAAARRP